MKISRFIAETETAGHLRFEFAGFVLDIDRGALLKDGVDIALRSKSFEVLLYLVERHGQLVTKEQLLDTVWADRVVTDQSLVQCMIEIRKALGDDSKDMIRTVQRRGYMLDLPVTVHEPGGGSVSTLAKSTIAVGFALLLILVFFFLRPEASVPIGHRSIAVLPFENRSSHEGNRFFTDGMHDELLATISRIGSMKVISRTSVMEYRDTTKNIPQIAQELGVAYILEGGIQRAGDQVRINVQLIDAASDEHLWAEIYDRELTTANLFAVQSEITKKIAHALHTELSTDEQLRIDAIPTDNLQAYELYLRGRYLWQRRGAEDLRHALALFEQATELDPQFARAWSSLAATHIILPVYSDAPSSEQIRLAASAAQKALALDDSLAEAYAVMGGLADMKGKWAEAEMLFLLAIANEPKDSTAHLWYGEHLFNLGRLDDALEEALLAYQLDPLHPATNSLLGWIYFYQNDTSNTLKYGASAWELGHTSGLYFQAWMNLRIGEFDRAVNFAEQWDEQIAELSDNLQSPIKLRLLIEAKIDAAKRPLLLEKLAEQETIGFDRNLFTGHVVFDLTDEAYQKNTMALDTYGSDSDHVALLWRSDMAPFRQDSRFAALVTRLGMVDYWREYGWPDMCRPTSARDFECD